MEATDVIGLVGVYNADGGLAGEARYVFGKLLGTAHCGLCDITHSPLRRKPEWDVMVARLALPFTLLHLNELDADVSGAVAEHGAPVVLGRLADGSVALVLGPEELDRLGGSVAAFEASARTALATRTRESGRGVRP